LSLPRAVWGALPARYRASFAIEPLRLLLPKCVNPAVPAGAPMYVVGFFNSPSGLGRGARLFVREQQRAGLKVHAVDVSRLLRVEPVPGLYDGPLVAGDAFAAHAGPGTVVVHANPPAFMAALWAVRRLLPGKRILAYWAWELEDIPPVWARCFDHVDEILVPSSFVAEAVGRRTTKPVRVHPHAAPEPTPLRSSPTRPFTVLHVSTFRSGFFRKNPLGVVEAFRRAFGDASDACLLLKISDIDAYPEGWKRLRSAAESANILFCLGSVSEQAVNDLYARTDVYMSLHRSEGYGLTIMEAMRHGLPVIATGWSGNMDFMDTARCRAVPYTLVPVDDPQGIYTIDGAVWAEPDIAAAAKMLRDMKDTEFSRRAYA
jgi:glycosyltransferase involved in cell wall biosynthesis